ncbi:hypothetical protein [Companilactobacillus zhachilii]|uniref:hypothetical protein n=1 Tax=Companilactobacillus zhachilii TaxID=2304606 RepID=UPI004033A6D4
MEIERTIIKSDDFPSLISKFAQSVKDTKPNSFFNGMSDKDIKELTFGEKIYQLEQATYVSSELSVKIIENKLYFQINPNKNSTYVFGYIPIDEQIKSILNKKYGLGIMLTGGKFKKVVTDSNGVESVQQFFEPLDLKAIFSYKETPSTIDKNQSDSLSAGIKQLLIVLGISGAIIIGIIFILGLTLT